MCPLTHEHPTVDTQRAGPLRHREDNPSRPGDMARRIDTGGGADEATGHGRAVVTVNNANPFLEHHPQTAADKRAAAAAVYARSLMSRARCADAPAGSLSSSMTRAEFVYDTGCDTNDDVHFEFVHPAVVDRAGTGVRMADRVGHRLHGDAEGGDLDRSREIAQGRLGHHQDLRAVDAVKPRGRPQQCRGEALVERGRPEAVDQHAQLIGGASEVRGQRVDDRYGGLVVAEVPVYGQQLHSHPGQRWPEPVVQVAPQSPLFFLTSDDQALAGLLELHREPDGAHDGASCRAGFSSSSTSDRVNRSSGDRTSMRS